MAIALDMDHHVPRAITQELRLRGVDVLTAADDHAEAMPDRLLLDRALSLRRVLVTEDADFLAEASRGQRSDEPFFGIVYRHHRRATIATCIEDLQTISFACEPEDVENSVIYLPLSRPAV